MPNVRLSGFFRAHPLAPAAPRYSWDKFIFFEYANLPVITNTVPKLNYNLTVTPAKLNDLFDRIISNRGDMAPVPGFDFHIACHDEDNVGAPIVGIPCPNLINLLNALQPDGTAFDWHGYHLDSVGISIEDNQVGEDKGNIEISLVENGFIAAPPHVRPNRLVLNFHINIRAVMPFAQTCQNLASTIVLFRNQWSAQHVDVEGITLNNFTQAPYNTIIQRIADNSLQYYVNYWEHNLQNQLNQEINARQLVQNQCQLLQQRVAELEEEVAQLNAQNAHEVPHAGRGGPGLFNG